MRRFRFVLSFFLLAGMAATAPAQTYNWIGNNDPFGGLSNTRFLEDVNWAGGSSPVGVPTASILLDATASGVLNTKMIVSTPTPLTGTESYVALNILNGGQFQVGETAIPEGATLFRVNTINLEGSGNTIEVLFNSTLDGGADIEVGAAINLLSGSTVVKGLGELFASTVTATGGEISFQDALTTIQSGVVQSAGTINIQGQVLNNAGISMTGGELNVASGGLFNVLGLSTVNENVGVSTVNVSGTANLAGLNLDSATVNVLGSGGLSITGTTANAGAISIQGTGSGSFATLNVNGGEIEVLDSATFTASGTTTLDGGVGLFGGSSSFQNLDLINFSLVEASGTSGQASENFSVAGNLSVSDSEFYVQGDDVTVNGSTSLNAGSSIYIESNAAGSLTTGTYAQSGGTLQAFVGSFGSTGAATISDGLFQLGESFGGTSGTASFGSTLDVTGSGTLIDIQQGSLTATGATTLADATISVGGSFNADGGFAQNSGLVSIDNLGQFNANTLGLVGGDFQVNDGTLNSGAATVSGGTFRNGDAGLSSGTSNFSSTLDLSGSGTLFNVDQGTVNVTGMMTVNEAELRIGDAGTLNANGGLTVDSGSVTGTGSVFADVTHNSGQLAPGFDSLADGGEFGVLTVDGSFTINGGSIELELGGDPASNNFDRVVVNGDVIVNGGQMNVSLLNGYDPLLEPKFVTSWNVVTINGSVGGAGLATFLGDVSDKGLKWDLSGLDFGSGGTIRLVAVPEPATYGVGGLLLAGMMFYGWRRRRQSRKTGTENTAA